MEIPIDVRDDKIICKRDRVKSSDQIQWTCDFPFTVDFGWETPLGNSGRYAVKASGFKQEDDGPYRTPRYQIYTDPDKKGYGQKFKYTVSIWKDDRILIGDPEIIIDP